jgi:hypothetical protein
MGGGLGLGGDAPDEVGEVDGDGVGEALFAAGQGQQPVDEPFVALVDGQQVGAELAQRLAGLRVLQGDLDEGAVDGQRGAELVGGVGDEAALAVEGGAVEALQHGVEGVGEVLELVVGAVQGDALLQVAVGDPAGGGGDVLQRPQRPAGQQPAEPSGGDADDPQGHQRGDQHRA